jgi:hypothetical protein
MQNGGMPPLTQPAFRDLNFARRANKDGTVDSICLHCFMTVATEQWEANLDKAERDHVCNGAERGVFEEIGKFSPRQSL